MGLLVLRGQIRGRTADFLELRLSRPQRRDPSRVGVKVSYLSGSASDKSTQQLDGIRRPPSNLEICLLVSKGRPLDNGSPGCPHARNGGRTTPQLMRG